MRAICLTNSTLEQVKAEVGRKEFRRIKRMMRAADILQIKIYFIPEYIFPESAYLPKVNFVTRQHLYQNFLVGLCIGETNWFNITPKRNHIPSRDE